MPQWQISRQVAPLEWATLRSDLIASQLEEAFQNPSRAPRRVDGTEGGQMFNVSLMLLGSQPVRRLIAPDDVVGTAKFRNNYVWEDYGNEEQMAIIEALRHGHKVTAVYVNGFAYDVVFKSFELGLQINRTTKTERDVHIWTAPLEFKIELKALSVEDSDDLPDDYRCPISCMPFEQPVVASDGHTYELAMIRKHMSSSTISPITKEVFSSPRLYPNVLLRKLMLAHKEKRAKSAPHAAQKKKRARGLPSGKAAVER